MILVDSQVSQLPSTSTIIDNSFTITNESSFNTTSTSLQTPQKLPLNIPRKNKLKSDVSVLKSKCTKLEKQVETLSKQVSGSMHSLDYFKEMCDMHLLPNLSMIVKHYVSLTKTKSQGYWYSNEIKQLALTIYFFGPRAYTFLKTIFQLPTTRTLCRISEKYEIVFGLNEILFEYISFKANNLSDDDKNCVLCVDEMAIKTNLYYNISKDYIVGLNNTFGHKT